MKSKSRAGIPDKITELLNAKYCFPNPQAISGRKRKLDPIFDNQNTCLIRVITNLPNSEQSNKGKVKTHKYINRQNQSTTGTL